MDHRARRPLSRVAPGGAALPLLLVLALLASALACGCGRATADLAGNYTAGDHDVRMELKDTGKGVLSTPDDDISFTWEHRDSEIWLHTKAGGVVVCTIETGGVLTTDMPGVGRLRFTRR